MTIGIAFITPYCAGIATDRRLTTVGRDAVVSETTKCGTVEFVDGHLCYSFTGLAASNKGSTAQFVAEALGRSGLGSTRAAESLKIFADAMTDWMKTVRAGSQAKRLTVILCGFTKDASGTREGVTYIVSNFHDADGEPFEAEVTDFRVFREVIPADVVLVRVIGRTSSIRREDNDDFAWKLANPARVPFDAAMRSVFRAIENTAAADKWVGRSCDAVVLSATEEAHVARMFVADEPVAVRPSAAYVCAVYGNRGAYILFDIRRELSDEYGEKLQLGHPTNRRKPCTCGSGKRYKNCCGRGAAAQQSHITFYQKTLSMPDDGSTLALIGVREDMGATYGAPGFVVGVNQS